MPRHRRYEYSVEGFIPVGEYQKLEQWLDKRGEEGWELVSCETLDPTKPPHVKYALVFMRER